ncbi:histidine kinase [Bradyrhizobium sp.]|uniref:sensor histidine kinase n=1 Tax=Bradyrhizobium sp. TaxID=376 RepID=UPI003C4C1A0E
MSISSVIDLKLRLALRVVAVAGFCFLATSAYVLVESDRSAHRQADAIAALVARDLELQQSQLHWVRLASDPFPDLERIASPLLEPGLCIAYRSGRGELVQRLCHGTSAADDNVPALFSVLYASLFEPRPDISHPVRLADGTTGTALVILDPARLIGQGWREVGQWLPLMAVTLSLLCLLVYAALARALRPTRAIVAGLERLSTGDLSTRLPDFDLAELSAIGSVFNALAAKLETTLGERNELTRRLIALQDQERLHLARELHDEFGQCLAAISAVAASAGHTAGQDHPALLPECRTIAEIAARMMDMLRGALVRLRPPDVDELGLAASLESLVAGWNARMQGRPRFEIELSGSFVKLPSALGVNLYRIAQEAITNAARHAEASCVTLHLRMRASTPDQPAPEIELCVDDDGNAKAIDLAAGAGRGLSGMGLVGMRERVTALGGRLRFEQRHPAGLTLHAIIPAPQMTDEAT